jgi:hypothetical protein
MQRCHRRTEGSANGRRASASDAMKTPASFTSGRTEGSANGRAASALITALKYWLADISRFSRIVIEKPLRPYQLEPASAICESVLHGHGHQFAVMMSRQAGKNELSGQLEAYLMNLYRLPGGQIVKASPTFKPQTINSILRLSDRLQNQWNTGDWRRREGYMVELGNARTLLFSAEPTANVVGATADLLLEGDEAQDITDEKWHRDFAPMAASSNATTVLYGTAWTTDTLLARTIQHLRQQEAADGIRRVFTYDADQVGHHVLDYKRYVDAQVRRLGRNHPLIRTQYYLETIDGLAGLFPPARRALMRGQHQRQHEPTPGHRYALLLDVAGEEESSAAASGRRSGADRQYLANPRRDATALTVVEVESRPHDLPLYRVVDRRLWLGVRHTTLYDQIRHLSDHWRAAYVVVDATGIGAGLASFLGASLERTQCALIPVVFSSKTKSELGWSFVGAVETGRFQDYLEDQERDTRQFWHEVKTCQYEVLPGPGERIKWGVWDPPAYDGLFAHGHDDLLVSAALCTILDQQSWPGTGSAEIVQRVDPLQEIDQGDW